MKRLTKKELEEERSALLGELLEIQRMVNWNGRECLLCGETLPEKVKRYIEAVYAGNQIPAWLCRTVNGTCVGCGSTTTVHKLGCKADYFFSRPKIGKL